MSPLGAALPCDHARGWGGGLEELQEKQLLL